MIDDKIKEAWKYITIAYTSSNHRILADAYVQAEARARLWEDDFWKQRGEKTLADYIAEVEEELSE